MEASKAPGFWELDALVSEIIDRVVATGKPVSVIIDEMALDTDLRLKPEDDWTVWRAGIVYIANGRIGMRGLRSGKVQSAGIKRRPLPEESAGLEEWVDAVLAGLIYEGADGVMRSVDDFTEADAAAAFHERVVASRERADREEPFWLAVMQATKGGKTVSGAGKGARSRLARLAVQAKLTTNGEPES